MQLTQTQFTQLLRKCQRFLTDSDLLSSTFVHSFVNTSDGPLRQFAGWFSVFILYSRYRVSGLAARAIGGNASGSERQQTAKGYSRLICSVTECRRMRFSDPPENTGDA